MSCDLEAGLRASTLRRARDRPLQHGHRVDADERGRDDARARLQAERASPSSATPAAPPTRRRRPATTCPRCARRRATTAFSAASFSSDVSRRPSSRLTACTSRRWACPPRRAPAPRRGRPRASKRPSSHARDRALLAAQAEAVGVLARDAVLLRDHLGALELRREGVVLDGSSSAAASRRPCSSRAARASSSRRRRRARRPRCRRRPCPAASVVACWLEPHWLSIVVAATSSGRPCDSQAVRAMLNDCSPTCDTQPPTIWPTRADRSRRARRRRAARRRADRRDGARRARPCGGRSGVRTAARMTTSCMGPGFHTDRSGRVKPRRSLDLGAPGVERGAHMRRLLPLLLLLTAATARRRRPRCSACRAPARTTTTLHRRPGRGLARHRLRVRQRGGAAERRLRAHRSDPAGRGWRPPSEPRRPSRARRRAKVL